MWIVRVALNRPYTFIVLALLILLASPVIILRTPTDIFPNINIPVIAVAWQFTGLNPEEMEGRFTTGFERILTTVVDNIEHIESTTINGQSIIKIFLQPNAFSGVVWTRACCWSRRSAAGGTSQICRSSNRTSHISLP